MFAYSFIWLQDDTTGMKYICKVKTSIISALVYFEHREKNTEFFLITNA